MKILRNGSHRFNIDDIKDTGKTGRKGAVKEGIAGYKCKALGWILEKIFKKAVAVKTADGTVYLNRKSLEQYLGRVKPENAPSKVDLEKLFNRSPVRVERALNRILHPKQPKIEPLYQDSIEEESIEEVPEQQSIIKVEKKPLYDSASIEAFLNGFKDKNLLGERFDEVQKIYQDFMEFIQMRNFELVFIQKIKIKDPTKSPEKPKVMGYYTWEMPGLKIEPMQIGSNMVKEFNKLETPGKYKTEKILRLATQMAFILNSALNEPAVD